MLREHFDVLIIGAGLSGIGAACSLMTQCPRKTFAMLEARHDIGGTWDLFRYPGIRSDSDMYTLGYSFRPWKEPRALADGGSILEYVRQTARDFQLEPKIRFGHSVTRASWSSVDAAWTVQVQRHDQGDNVSFSCNFLFVCAGYYSYRQGHTPSFPMVEQFKGQIVHPQQWPQNLDYAGKRIVVIGSGATAVTLVPAMAKSAAHVTMLQRSPSYVVAARSRDALMQLARLHLPPKLAYRLIRWRNILFGIAFFQLCRRKPQFVRDYLLRRVQASLGPDYDVATHFAPRYNPWDQRMCLVPDGDLFSAIRNGRASVATGKIDRFTPTGIRLADGSELPADIIVTATGLNLALLGDVQLSVDGRAIELAGTVSYKGTMYSGVPNLASTFGYTNASWTLKCELTCEYVCRLLNYMDRTGRQFCVPQFDHPVSATESWLNLTSGYVQRSAQKLPRQGLRHPWKINHNYLLDLLSFKFGAIDDGVLRFHYNSAH